MFQSPDLFGINDFIVQSLLFMTIGSLVLGVLGLIYAIRSWQAQSAVFQNRKDIKEIKQLLKNQTTSLPKSSVPPTKDDFSTDGRHIAKQIDKKSTST